YAQAQNMMPQMSYQQVMQMVAPNPYANMTPQQKQGEAARLLSNVTMDNVGSVMKQLNLLNAPPPGQSPPQFTPSQQQQMTAAMQAPAAPTLPGQLTP